MTIRSSAKLRIVRYLGIMAILTLASPPLLGQVTYSVTDLGGGAAYGINNRGEVVGQNSAGHAFLYSGGRMIDVSPSTATNSTACAINNNGQIVGYSRGVSGDFSAFLYSEGTATILPFAFAYDINDDGLIVGVDTSEGGILYSNDTIIDLPSWSEAIGINNNGQVVGEGPLFSLFVFGYVYNGGTSTVLSGLCEDIHPDMTSPQKINNSGQITGVSMSCAGTDHAVLWNGGSTIDLGTLGGSDSCGYGLNNKGQAVGYAYTSSGISRAFLYSGNVMTELNSLINSDSGWTLISAEAINDNGQIVGYGINAVSQTDAFLLTPVNELYAIPLGGNLIISWFTNATTNVALFQSTNVAAESWEAVTNIPTITNAMNQVVIRGPLVGNCFYRLYTY